MFDGYRCKELNSSVVSACYTYYVKREKKKHGIHKISLTQGKQNYILSALHSLRCQQVQCLQNICHIASFALSYYGIFTQSKNCGATETAVASERLRKKK
jgi:hypothetical protein